jgi:hypothetical protein
VVISLGEMAGPSLYGPVGSGLDKGNLQQIIFIIFQPWRHLPFFAGFLVSDDPKLFGKPLIKETVDPYE